MSDAWTLSHEQGTPATKVAPPRLWPFVLLASVTFASAGAPLVWLASKADDAGAIDLQGNEAVAAILLLLWIPAAVLVSIGIAVWGVIRRRRFTRMTESPTHPSTATGSASRTLEIPTNDSSDVFRPTQTVPGVLNPTPSTLRRGIKPAQPLHGRILLGLFAATFVFAFLFPPLAGVVGLATMLYGAALVWWEYASASPSRGQIQAYAGQNAHSDRSMFENAMASRSAEARRWAQEQRGSHSDADEASLISGFDLPLLTAGTNRWTVSNVIQLPDESMVISDLAFVSQAEMRTPGSTRTLIRNRVNTVAIMGASTPFTAVVTDRRANEVGLWRSVGPMRRISGQRLRIASTDPVQASMVFTPEVLAALDSLARNVRVVIDNDAVAIMTVNQWANAEQMTQMVSVMRLIARRLG